MYKYYRVYDYQHYCSMACGIDLGDSYVVSGGADTSVHRLALQIQTVVQYSIQGKVTYLAKMNTGRYSHACSKYVNDNGETVS